VCGGAGADGRVARAARLGVRDEPLQRDIDILLVLAGDRVAADFALGERREVPAHRQSTRNKEKENDEDTVTGVTVCRRKANSYDVRVQH
jgi:hypothetical protein